MNVPPSDDPTHIDALTQLYSRKTFLELFAAALVAARANLYPLSIALLDIDLFKRLNESAGHDNGDGVRGRWPGALVARSTPFFSPT
jgi:diguanylate cyclase (GGDEF)-like protein